MPASITIKDADGTSRTFTLNSAPVDRSGTTSPTPNAVTQVMGANPNRLGFSLLPRHVTASVEFSDTGAADGVGARTLPPGKEYVSVPGAAPTGAITIASSVAYVAYTAKEW